MTDGIRLKVCGITKWEDAEFAVQSGADYLGFILHPESPSYLSLEKYGEFAWRLPEGRKVAVMVEPTLAQLSELDGLGFDYFQVHFRHDFPTGTIAAWSEKVGPTRLWLAPKLPPEAPLPPTLLPLTKTFLFDTFHVRKFGGTGETGDWLKFAHYKRTHPKKTWILSGGLNPENIVTALKESGTRFVDVNSGVTLSPGVKDHAKLRALVEKLHERRT
ncbi:MAG: phosphoribosylanthranilate isomerase [Opitutaceae bacterium]